LIDWRNSITEVAHQSLKQEPRSVLISSSEDHVVERFHVTNGHRLAAVDCCRGNAKLNREPEVVGKEDATELQKHSQVEERNNQSKEGTAHNCYFNQARSEKKNV
jgi:hypothetical protein